ncbi:metal cation symporter ZIP8 [Aplysia californica]|uniref:Metal cation symporter ZIP8 n=1 Tax=Aplysia californica TaxID=6500 RepID=A0ABM0K8V9_APLCA|nr:metal cation symporter ZIP8 [Aplysia californica]XP_035829137.1 metal cation symporter ZIP8 [Aplysia californica]
MAVLLSSHWFTQMSVMLVLVCSLLLTVTQHCAAKNDSELLRTVFSSALAGHVSSVSSLASQMGAQWLMAPNVTAAYNETCFQTGDNFTTLARCLETEMKCVSLHQVEELYSLPASEALSSTDVSAVSPALLFSLLSCDKSAAAGTRNGSGAAPDEDESGLVKPTSEASWGYSFLFVTLINLCSLTGALVFPCMKLHSYKIILMFMVALAVGTLAGSGLLFLIPEAFALVHDDDRSYLWKASTVMGGIYLFYIIERSMRLINNRRENTNLKKRQDELATQDTITTSFRRTPVDNCLPGRDPANLPTDLHGICSSSGPEASAESSGANTPYDRTPDAHSVDDEVDISVAVSSGAGTTQLQSNGDGLTKSSNGVHRPHHNHHHELAHSHSQVAPVAYMIIFGDALHNFIDGLSIGSAFTQSIMTGVSVSVAVMCEELPHELGDFAILLNSGMPFKRAIMYNFLSACTCYLGVVIGILLGENTQSHEWIFAVAGGMFLYISLVDMMPEMNTAAESVEGRQFGPMKTFILQNLGLLTGYAIMLLMALYAGEISFE